jgi:hypothetical protein
MYYHSIRTHHLSTFEFGQAGLLIWKVTGACLLFALKTLDDLGVLIFAFITLFAVLLHACGGGRGGDDSSDTTTNAPPSGRLNPQLSGRVFVYRRGAPSQILDLSTGVYSLIPGIYKIETLALFVLQVILVLYIVH